MLSRRARVRCFSAGVTSAFNLCPSVPTYDAIGDARTLLGAAGISPPGTGREFVRLVQRAAQVARIHTYRKAAKDAHLTGGVRSALEKKVAAEVEPATRPLMTLIPARPRQK